MKYLDYVNIKQGTKSKYNFSNGNTLPLVQLPNGMISFAQQTNPEPSWWYEPDVNFIEGIRITHQLSPWIADYGCLLITPQSDVISDSETLAHSGMDYKSCVLTPSYMRTDFLRSECRFELVPSQRSAKLKLSYGRDADNFLSLFSVCGSTHFEVMSNEVVGYTFNTHDVDAKDFKMYFEITADNDCLDTERTYIVENDTDNAVIHIALNGKKAELNLAISYISYEQAQLNAREVEALTFDELKKNSDDVWEEYLSRIQIKTEDEEKLETFYSCMYRAFTFPHKAYEIDADGKAVHYSPFTGKICDGVRYTGNCYWDTYRTNFALYSMIDKKLYEEVLESLLCDYNESGWLPRCSSMYEMGAMPSTLIDSVISEAATAGIGDKELLTKLMYAMIKHAEQESENPIFGRNGIKDYLKYGYVPCDRYKESVNLTLDFAYGDYCIAKTAECLGYSDIKEKYLKRAENYKNVFDNETGFMRGKTADGKFKTPFDPISWGGEYTEACAWQTTFSVQHDYKGLAELMGGKDKLINMLTKIFTMEPHFRIGGYNTEIHEITEMALLNMGICEMNNQPGFVLPFIFAYFGETETCRHYVSRICDEMFTADIDGFPGDEDTGSMAAWYILSMIGKYPICPADNTYVEISPLVEYEIKEK